MQKSGMGLKEKSNISKDKRFSRALATQIKRAPTLRLKPFLSLTIDVHD